MSDDEAQAHFDNYLFFMLEAAHLVRQQIVQGVPKDEFLTDHRTQKAIVLNLMTIGEAAARIVNKCKEFAGVRRLISSGRASCSISDQSQWQPLPVLRRDYAACGR